MTAYHKQIKKAAVRGAPKGAYVLLFELAGPLDIVLRGKTFTLNAGHYAYCGSARGPGGLAARVGRHMARDKKPHWHIDQVTLRVPVLEAVTSTTLSECDLVHRLAGGGQAFVPIPGFGASDCKTCQSHFIGLAGRGAFDLLGLDVFEP